MLRKTLVPRRTQIRLSWALTHTLGYFVKSVRSGNRILPNLNGGVLGIHWQTKKEGRKHLPLPTTVVYWVRPGVIRGGEGLYVF